MFIEFKEEGNVDFYIFKFHNYFDGLLGIDILSKLNAKIDLSTNFLITNNSKIQLSLKHNLTSGRYEVPSTSKFIVKIPVDTENGNFFVKKTYIQPYIYQKESTTQIIGIAYDKWVFSIEDLYNRSTYSNTTIRCTGKCGLTEDIVQVLRTDHLNVEEKKSSTNSVKTTMIYFFGKIKNSVSLIR